ncbi:hypothetical protein TetV_510 [Tetraselmis virus 1]|uniref:Uncharacterized protein n=1 Tax=Tetraselmis virus 1 TaxID=2060617 RepID=A0A2P0VNX3_9VIRU|nr:hypothetical protein QJ968_gp544 [Tetraselmis virus 1]AUF82592.1 hypothetical protein TetV_510 [Tetraselmis virus 1]
MDETVTVVVDKNKDLQISPDRHHQYIQRITKYTKCNFFKYIKKISKL